RSYPDALTNLGALLFAMHYSEQHCNNSTLHAARLFGRHAEPPRQHREYLNVPEPHRRLRIGYVSADFRNHPVAYLFYGALAAHDLGQVEIYCYSNHPTDDDMTARIRDAVHGWRTIVAMSDTDVEAVIRRDEIDILVDLGGHTLDNRL